MSRKKELQKRLNTVLDEMETLATKAADEGRDFDEDEQKAYDEHKRDIGEIKALLDREEELEEMAKLRAVPVQPDAPNQTLITGGAPSQPKKGLKAGLLVEMARAMYHSGGHAMVAAQVAGQMGLKRAEAVYKAVTNPADTTTAGWAAELVQEAYGDFVELLRPRSVYARTPGLSAVLGRNGKLLFPGMTTGVGGAWVGEGDPIPVAQGVTNKQEITPYKLGVMTVQNRELMERSTPSSDVIIRDSMVRDTAIVLDTTFVSADAAVAGTSPAGIRNGVVPLDGTPAGATNTIAEVDSFLKNAINACLTLNMDMGLVWLLNPTVVLSLKTMSTATGTYPYKDDLNAGMLMNIPVLESNTVPATEFILLHSESLYKLVEGAIEMAMSTDATLHTNTAPEYIVSGGVAPTIPAEGNVLSMFQNDQVALRLIMPASWGVLRTGAVQVVDRFVLP